MSKDTKPVGYTSKKGLRRLKSHGFIMISKSETPDNTVPLFVDEGQPPQTRLSALMAAPEALWLHPEHGMLDEPLDGTEVRYTRSPQAVMDGKLAPARHSENLPSDAAHNLRLNEGESRSTDDLLNRTKSPNPSVQGLFSGCQELQSVDDNRNAGCQPSLDPDGDRRSVDHGANREDGNKFPVGFVQNNTLGASIYLSLSSLQRAHITRQEEWCLDQKPDLSFRGNELGGECGEAQNVIKKLERERHGWRGSRDTVEHLAEELADVIHCTILVAITAGIDIERAVIAKFNSTSEKNGLSTVLAATEGSTDA